MLDILDSIGRVACKLEPATWYIESAYRGCKTSAHLAAGESFTVERQGQITTVTRIDNMNFMVQHAYTIV